MLKAKLGPDHPDTLSSMNNLAAPTMPRPARRGLKLYEETLGDTKAKLGPDHPETLTSHEQPGQRLRGRGRHAEALKLREETLALKKAKLGPDHPDTLETMNNLAEATMPRPAAEALPLHEETLALMKAKLGPDHPNTLTA